MNEKILIVEDDLDIAKLMRIFLKKEGYQVYHAADGQTAIGLFREVNPDLIVLDIMLPDSDGKTLCENFRQTTLSPIIFVTALQDEEDRIEGLDLGADDYLAKPFSMKELSARVRAQLRRANFYAHNEQHTLLRFKGMALNLENLTVTINGQLIPLTESEFTLLSTMARAPGKIFGYEHLYRKITGQASHGDYGALLTTMSRLRKKIELHPNLKYIHTIRGNGYKFSEFV